MNSEDIKTATIQLFFAGIFSFIIMLITLLIVVGGKISRALGNPFSKLMDRFTNSFKGKNKQNV